MNNDTEPTHVSKLDKSTYELKENKYMNSRIYLIITYEHIPHYSSHHNHINKAKSLGIS